MRRTATFDPTKRYRYQLGRSWDSTHPRVTFVMLNPSAADAYRDDPTIRRCIGFAKAWGYGALTIVNLFAYRTADPRELARAMNPVGPDNNRALRRVRGDYERRARSGADTVVAAWGIHGGWLGRDGEVLELLAGGPAPLKCLGLTMNGHPRHVLYLPGHLRPRRFSGSGRAARSRSK